MNDVIYFRYNTADHNALESLFISIDNWTNSDELTGLVESFGAIIPPGLNLEERSRWLLEFSKIWDYRGRQKSAHDTTSSENMRWMVSSDEITCIQKQNIERSIRKLGLAGYEVPSSRDYDYILVLGGARLSCLLRTRFSERLYSGISDLRGIALLAAYRLITDSERQATDTYAMHAVSEFDLMNAAVEQEFHLECGYSEKKYTDYNQNKSWAIREYKTTQEKLSIYSLAAPSSDPESRRANSADTFEFFFTNIDVPAQSSLLLITSQIYVPYQQLEGIRTIGLSRNVSVETIGFPLSWNQGLQGMNQPSNYLQEIRSTIQSINRLIERYPRI